ncbi:protein OPI10 homolog [Physcomitrium patens]|uniref:Hikeshi-like domain-containing protein n=1 Tax=Physcomitrium patens TaxID=3218 RepID=A9TJ75_PHYPA|nr:protein OPI10 homolog [Physcomitrium patens]PNR37245.1 hypothetical protein PHYPA_020353 [Physcomitrium patens]|eukprot:XP_024399049.1 protein OPI10 homolog [Physcomitrella patens]
MFGVLFPNRSFPLGISTFNQVDEHRWLLDMNYFVGEAYDQVKEMCVFLLNEMVLPAGKSLAVYVQAPGSQFEYRGAVHSACPSAVFPLLWPGATSGPMLLTGPGAPGASAQIGISVEDLATLPSLNVGHQKRVEEIALKVGENLFNFMQSFGTTQGGKLIVPMDILNQWFKKFQEKARRDPDYLNRFTM